MAGISVTARSRRQRSAGGDPGTGHEVCQVTDAAWGDGWRCGGAGADGASATDSTTDVKASPRARRSSRKPAPGLRGAGRFSPPETGVVVSGQTQHVRSHRYALVIVDRPRAGGSRRRPQGLSEATRHPPLPLPGAGHHRRHFHVHHHRPPAGPQGRGSPSGCPSARLQRSVPAPSAPDRLSFRRGVRADPLLRPASAGLFSWSPQAAQWMPDSPGGAG